VNSPQLGDISFSSCVESKRASWVRASRVIRTTTNHPFCRVVFEHEPAERLGRIGIPLDSLFRFAQQPQLGGLALPGLMADISAFHGGTSMDLVISATASRIGATPTHEVPIRKHRLNLQMKRRFATHL